LSRLNAAELPSILRGFENANPLAANYLRGAVEAIADRTLKEKQPLPAEELEKFVANTGNDPRARRLAYELLQRLDSTISDRLIPEMLLDPSPEFRRDAVARLLNEGTRLLNETKDQESAKATLLRALRGATDADQVKEIVKQLKTLNVEVDLQKHFGFLTTWRFIGPFDNVAFKGFDSIYPPEEKLDYTARYEGQKGEVAWDKVVSDHEYGIINIAKQIAPYKGATMYLATDFHSPAARSVELRLGTPNAWKIWVN